MSEKPIEPGMAVYDLLKKVEEAGAVKLQSRGKVHKRLAQYAGTCPVPNLAVEICDQMFALQSREAIDQGKPYKDAMRIGKIAYCSALPKLSGVTNIRDFIACVTYAMALEIIPGSEGTRLLYAAQVAHMALAKRPKKRNKSSHTRTASSESTKEKSTT